jgi:hypothetical protein
MKHAHDTSVVIDGEEDPIAVRLPPVGQHPHRVVGVEIFGRYGTTFRMLVEREDGAFETVEPFSAPLGPPGRIRRGA